MNCVVSIMELYGVETMLIHGYSTRFAYVPKEFTKRITADLGLTRGSNRRYYGDPDAIYEYFRSNYSNYIKRYNVHDYGSLIATVYKNMI